MEISFLLGSGFSIPEGLPSVTELNQRLKKINEEEIIIASSQIAFFLNGQVDNNRWDNADSRLFLQDFLAFYNEKVLTPEECFHYETFYDFYSGYLNDKKNKDVIEEFYHEFNKTRLSGTDGHRDCYNRVNDFNRTFNQLVASLLHQNKYIADISCINYPPYDAFIGLLKSLLNSGDTVSIHTLNHDLFFDYLGQHHVDLWQHFSDGFTLEGSPFYGRVEYNMGDPGEDIPKNYMVKLARYTGKFDKRLRFYKLHGSINSTIAYIDPPAPNTTRIKSGYGVQEYFVERPNAANGEPEFAMLHNQVDPDFLSGTTNKIRFYSKDPYYKELFDHFVQNLRNASLLIVTGYGFHDSGINDYIEKEYLSKGGRIVIIDPSPILAPSLNQYNVTQIASGITDVSYGQLLNCLDSE